MGVPKRRVSHARQGERRAHLALEPAAARGVSALPPAEAPAPRLPELRLLRRPPGVRDQETPTSAGLLTGSPRIDRPENAARGPERRPPRDGRRSGSPSTRWAATTRPPEVVPGALDHAAAHPEDQSSSSATRRASGRRRRRRPAGQRGDRPREPGHRDGRAPGAAPSARSSDASITRRDATSSATARPTRVVTAGHTGRRRWPRRSSASAACPASTGPPWPSRWSPTRARSCSSTSARTPTRRRENLAQYARMGALFAERVLGIATPRVALLSIGEEKGKGDAADPAGDGAARRHRTCNFVGNVEGKDLVDAHGRRRRLRRRRRQRRRSSSSRASRPSSSTCCGASSGGRSRGRSPTCCMRPGHRPDPEGLRLRAARRLAAPRRQGHGDHHPRPGEAADDRLRAVGRRGDAWPGPADARS